MEADTLTSQQLLRYRVAMSAMRGMNPTLARDLLRCLGHERALFEASETQLRYITGSHSRIYTREYRDSCLAKADSELRFMATHGHVQPLHFTDPRFPQRLLECDDAPTMLYSLGHTDLNTGRSLAVVGTRHATPYGLEFTRRLIHDLARLTDGTVTVVSGLAYGIDVAAHRAALEAGLPTVAVLAHGLHTIYPADHRATAVEMVRRGGMLLSEYRTDEPTHKGNFVARNRIVAGMTDCLLVVESALHGGALITARLAGDYCREVFAVPGRVTDTYSAGCCRLIADNAASLITDAESLCRAMGWAIGPDTAAQVSPQLPMALNPEEEAIVKYLETTADDVTVSQITAATGLPVGPLMSTLIELEFRGLVLGLPGSRWRKV